VLQAEIRVQGHFKRFEVGESKAVPLICGGRSSRWYDESCWRTRCKTEIRFDLARAQVIRPGRAFAPSGLDKAAAPRAEYSGAKAA